MPKLIMIHVQGAQGVSSLSSPIPPPPTSVCRRLGMSRAYVVMGVSGCGKSTVGQALANSLGCPFYDGDDYHPDANIKKMSAGKPLNDSDRQPWLLAVHEVMKSHIEDNQSCVVACSALKTKYRSLLRTGEKYQPPSPSPSTDTKTPSSSASSSASPPASSSASSLAPSTSASTASTPVSPSSIVFVYLKGSFDLISQRMQARQNHFFKADMLRSQFDALEEPSSTIGDDEKLDNKIDAADGDHRTEHKHANPSDAHRVRNGATDGDTRESARAGGVQCKDPVDTSKGDAAIVIDMDDSDLSSVLQIITAINKALQ